MVTEREASIRTLYCSNIKRRVFRYEGKSNEHMRIVYIDKSTDEYYLQLSNWQTIGMDY